MLTRDERTHLGFAIGSGATLRARTFGTSFSTSASAVFSPIGTATEIAMQRSPAEP
jgi:hypothetical protein